MITYTINQSTLSRYWKFLCVIIVILSLPTLSLNAQECILGDEEVLAKWDYNSENFDCNGADYKRGSWWTQKTPMFIDGANEFCPNINSGCGQAVMGAHKFGNTNNFKNGICMAGFNGGNWNWNWNHATDWDPNSTTFNPDAATFFVKYSFPAGQPGILTGFTSTVVSRGNSGGGVQFEKQGIAVYRNGALIYTTEIALTTANTNQPLKFTFPSTGEFKTDGSANVQFEVRTAMVHRLTSGLSGLDDLCINGICGSSGGADIAANPSTCRPDETDNGTLTVTGFTAGEKYDYNLGTTYAGSETFATATAIPTNGIIVDTIGVKAAATDYTIRVFREDCFQDVTVTMPPTFCPYDCDFPDAAVAVTQATCSGATANNNARIDLTGISDATRIGMSVGRIYTGPDFAGATDLSGAASYAFENIDNPTCKEYYTIRIFNGSDGKPDLCIKTFTVVLDEVSCNGCMIACAEIIGSESVDTVFTDDTGKGELCVDSGNIDIELTKTVTPNVGETCPSETEFVWTITVTNTGNITATDILVFESLAIGLSADNINPSVGSFNGFGNWDIPSLAPNASETLTFSSKAAAAGTYENCAYVVQAFPDNDIDSSPDNDYTANEDDDACATITVTGPSLPTVSKDFSPLTTKPNLPSTLILKLTNNDSLPIALTQDFVDVLPNDPAQMTVAADPNIQALISGIIAEPGAGTITIQSGTVLQPGVNEIKIDVVAPTVGFYCNVIGIGDLVTTACTNIDRAVGCLEVGDFLITPIVSKSFNKEVAEVGDDAVITITVENRNDVNFNVVQDFYDEIPAGLSLNGAITGTCPSITNFGGDSLRIGIAEGAAIPPGGCTIEVPVTVTQAREFCNVIEQNSLVVTGTVNGITEMAGNRTEAKATLVGVSNPIFDLALKKTLAEGQNDTVRITDTVRYEITVYNQGTADATNVSVIDYVPSDLVPVPDVNWTASGSDLVLTNPIPTLKAGADTAILATFTLNPSFSGTSIINMAEINSATGGTDKDSDPDNIENNDKGGKVTTPTDNNIFGNAKLSGGTPQDENGLTDEDDADPAIVYFDNSCDTLKVSIDETVCQGNNFDFNGQTLTTDGVYFDTLMASTGCDSIITLTLTVLPNTTGTETYTGCEGDGYSVVVGATTYNESNATGSETLVATNGCDSVVTVNLVFNPATTGTETYTGCEDDGYSVVVGSTTYNEGNPTGTETLVAANGCDSVVTVALVYKPHTTGTETYSGCNSDGYSVVVGPTTYNEGNPTGTETLVAANGCDSVVTVNLVFQSEITGTETYNGCEGDGYSVVVGSTTYNEGNPTGSETLTAVAGCDSVVTVTLVFNPATTGTETYAGCEGDGYSVVVGSTTYNEGNPIGSETLADVNGCDSVVTVTLVFNPATTGTETYAGCEGDGYSVVVGSTTYNEGNPTGSETLSDVNGCDSVVTVTLIYKPHTTGTETYSGCNSDGYSVVVGPTTYNEGNPTGTETLVAANGCDSVVTVNLVFQSEITGTETYAGCEGDDYSVVVGSTTYNEGNPTGTETLTAAAGCDSVVTVTLVFNPATTGTETYAGCEGDGYSVVVGSTTYNEGNPTGSETLADVNGCDSVVTVALVFNPATTGTETYVGCEGDGYSVVVGSTTYNEGNPTGSETLADVNGCDSVVTVALVFNPATTGTETYSGCESDGYSVVVGSTTYNEGNPTGSETLVAANGCDSVVTVNLVFQSQITGTETYNGCEGDGYTVVVGSTTYNEGNPTGSETLTAAAGCDSIVTVSLVFNPATTGTETYAGCEGDGYSVVVGSTTYNEGNPTGSETLADVNGCDSVVTVALVFNPATTGTETYSGCESDGYSVVVGSTTYNEGNPTGSETLADANGCDSVVTVSLVFNPATTGTATYAGCEGDGYSVVVGSTTYNEGNPTGSETLTNANGCDSVVTVNLVFQSQITGTETYNGCEGDGYSVVVGSTIYNEGNPTGSETLTAVAGCDSVVTVTLVFNPATTGTETYTGCEGDGYSVVVGSTTYNEGNPTGSETLSDVNGCDSVVTVTLVFNPATTGTATYAGCEGDGYSVVVGSTTYNEGNPTGSEILSDVNGCDSVVTVTLVFNPATTGTATYAGCEGDGYSVVVGSTTYNEGNPTGSETLTAANGCDSIVTVSLVFDPTMASTVDYAGCEEDGYSVVVGSTTYNEGNPTGTETLISINGCDSIVTVNLVFKPISRETITYNGCEEDGYEVLVNGVNYNEDNPLGTEILTAANGCDSIITINLTFNPLSDNACGKFDLALEKSTDSTTVRLGDLVTYQIKVTNEGTIDAYNIGITDFVPDGMSLADNNWTGSGDTARFNTPIAFLPAGNSFNLYITLKVDLDFTGTTLKNIAEISTADDDEDSTNTPPTDEDSTPDEDPTSPDEDDDDSAVINVIEEGEETFDLGLIETLAPGQEGMVRPGEMVDFKITIFNQGTLPAETIEITQYLPVGLTLNTANTQGWTAVNDSTATINVTLPSGGLAPDSMIMVMIQVVVAEDAVANKLIAHAEISEDGANDDTDSTPDNDRNNDAGGIPNTGTDDSSDQTPPTDEDDEDPVQIMLQEFDLALTEELVTTGALMPGDSVTAKIKVFNQGDIPADNIKLFAYIPNGLTLSDAAWIAMNDSTAMRTLTIAAGDLPADGLVADEMTMVTINFVIDPTFMEDCLITYAEIGNATDEVGNPVTDTDSTPDDDRTNDAGGVVQTSTDNQIYSMAPADEDDHDPVKITLVQRFDLALEKCTDSTVVNLGDLVTYQIKITNEGTVDAYSINITDFIPTGMSLQDGNWTADGNKARYNTPITFLAAGDKTSIEITLQVDATYTNTSLVNFAEISAADDDEDPNNTPPTDEDSTPDEDPTNEDEDDDDSAVITVVPPVVPTDIFDLALIETLAPGQEGMVRPGEMVDFKITVFNQGTLPAETIEITQYLPAGLTLNAANAQGWTAVNDSTITITLNAGDELPAGGLVSGEMIMVMIQVVVDENLAMGKLTAHAEISDDGANEDHDSTPDSDRTNDAGGVVNTSSDDRIDQIPPSDEDDEDPVQIMLLEFDLALTEELITEGPIAPGDSVTTKVKVFNQGMIPADSIKLFAYIPAGLNLADAAWMVMNDSTAMRTLTIADGDLPANGLVADEMTMVTIDFIVDPTFTDTCLITYAEIGNATDEQGNPVTDIDSTPDGDSTNDTGGEVHTPTDDEVNETAPTDEDDHDPAKIVVDQTFDLALEKSTDSTIVRLGDLVTYQIKITNEGTVDAYNIGITDFIPTGMSLQDGNWTASGDTARYNTPIAFLAAGQATTIEIILQVDAGFTSTSLVNFAEISSADDDNDPNNTPPTDEDSTPDEDPMNPDEDDDDAAVITVLPPSGSTDIFDLAITETLAPGQEGMVRPGETVDFKITVFNQGNVAADTIKIMQYLPAGLTLNTANAQGWTAMDDSTAMLLLTAGNGLPVGGLAPNEMEMVIIQTVVTTTPTSNKLTAYAEISEDGVNNEDVDSTPDDNRTNDTGGVPNTDSDDTTDQIPPRDEDDHDPVQIMLLEFDLALTEELITEGPIAPGDSVTTKVKVFNQGTIPADSIKLFAYIPAGLNLADAAWMVMNDSTAMRTLTIADGDLPADGLVADEMTMVTIDFIVDPTFMDTCLITYAEIGDATDEQGNPVTDIDSTPDGDSTNDTGGEVHTPTDDEVNETAPTDEDDHDPAKIVVDQTFDLALEKSTDVTIVRWGDLVTYQIKITNEGTIDAYRIGITDFLPTGMSLQDGNWTASGDTLRLNAPIAFLAASQDTTVEITLRVNEGVTSTSLVNYAEISSTDDDDDPNNTPPTDEDSTPDEDPTNEDEDDDDTTVVTVLPPDGEDPTEIFDLAIIQTLAPGQEGMVRPGAIVDFKITVFNQGNVAADTIKIMEYLPAGLTLNTANAQGWMVMDDSTAMLLLTAGNGLPVGGLAPDSMVMVMIQTIVATDAPTSKLTAYAEISEDGAANEDVDSTPDDDRTNDTGGVPNTDSDDSIDQIPSIDEDDHDPVQIMLLEFDLALTEELITEGPIAPGDSITGKIKVFNQGDIPADNIKIFAYIPAGMTLADDEWTSMDDSTAMRTLTVTGGVLPAEMTMVTIDFIVDPTFMDTCLITYAEIGDATDEQGNPVTDIDSTPDDDRSNDTGGEVHTPTDNEVNETAPTDEDDHDPVKIAIVQNFDLALKIELAPNQALEIANEDTICFNITVINQGTQDAYDIGIVNYVPAGLTFDAGLNQNLGHNWQADSTYQLAALPIGESAIIPIKFIADVDVLDSIIVDTAEIFFATNEDGSPVNTTDIDSEADKVNEDVIGGDNITNNDRGDEDDHDFVYVVPLREVDPIGFIYADKSGKIIKGGTISVNAPPGGVVFMIEDGSDGMYQWYTNGVQGEYTMTYTHPDGLIVSPNCNPQAGVYDPTGRDGDVTDMDGDGSNGVIQLGTVDVSADSTYLLNPTCSNNPYYLRFFLQSGDPIINANHIPIEESFIGSIVCEDSNGNGQADPGEGGIPNALVYLYNCADTINPIDSTVTNGAGEYNFDGLNAGDYMVQFTAPDGYRLPVDAVPVNEIAQRGGYSPCINLTTGACDTTTTVCMTTCTEIVATVSADSITRGESVTISVNGGPIFMWSANTGITNSTTNTVTLSPTVNTTYTVTVDDGYGCSQSLDIPIAVDPGIQNFLRLTDPCECTSESLNDTPIFNDRITIFSEVANENWSVAENNGIYINNNLVPVGNSFVEGGVVNGFYTYTLAIAHLDETGYLGKFTNGVDTLSASNICFADQSCNTTIITDPDGTPAPPVEECMILLPVTTTPHIDTLKDCSGCSFSSDGSEDNALYADTTARNNVITICAETPWQTLLATFDQFDLAAGDTLYVFEGRDTMSPLIDKFSGAGVSQTGGWVGSDCKPSVNPYGCLTFQFKTNGDNGKSLGWSATMTCSGRDIELTPPNDLSAKVACSEISSVFTINPATIKADCGTVQDSQIVRIYSPQGAVCKDTCLAFDENFDLEVALGSYRVEYKLKSDTTKTANAVLSVQAPNLVCNDEVTIPLGAGCSVTLLPDDLLENPCDTLTDTMYYYITLAYVDENGKQQSVSGGGKGGDYPTISKGMLGSCGGTVTATIERRYFENTTLAICNAGQVSAECSTIINVVDQSAPLFQNLSAVDTFKLCSADLSPDNLGIPTPSAIDNCEDVEVVFVGINILNEGGACDTTRAQISWRATDACGNVANATQLVVILRPDANDVVQAPDVVLSCGEDDESAINDLAKTGMPGLRVGKIVNGLIDPKTADTIALDTMNYTCGYILQKRDIQVPADCGVKVFRYWSVLDWCDAQGGITPLDTQFIALRDTLAPAFVADTLETATINLPHDACTTDLEKLARPVATDLCSEPTVRLDAVFRVENGELWPVGSTGLDSDSFQVRWVAEDDCHAQLINDTLTQIVLIEDNNKPSAVCTDQINFSLARSEGTLHYREIDAGSSDPCGIAKYEVSRDEVNWDSVVTLTCEDAHTAVQVYLRVTDKKGNQNTCWMTVNVEDKIAPICSDLPDMTGTCDEGHGSSLAVTDANENGQMDDDEWVDLSTEQSDDFNDKYGYPNCSDNVDCGALVIQQQYQLIEKGCGIATIKRRYRAIDWNGEGKQSNWSEQRIDIESKADWSITLPVDWKGQCGETVPSSEILIKNGACDLLAYEVEEKVFTTTEEACSKVVRTFTIINWCKYEAGGETVSITRVENEHGMVTEPVVLTAKDYENVGRLEYIQILKLKDETAPVITIAEVDNCLAGADCGDNKQFAITATDCNPATEQNLVYNWAISAGDTELASGEGAAFNYPVLPKTTYEVRWTVSDNCGNTATETQTYNFWDCKKPSPYCLNGIAVELMPDAGMIQVWASDLERNSTDNCTAPDKLQFRIWHAALGAEPTHIAEVLTLPEVITFDCATLGTQTVNLYVIDEDNNWDFCVTYVIVQDNMDACNNAQEMAVVSGTIADWKSNTVEDVMVHAMDDMEMMTEENGQFDFELAMYNNYTIQPEKNDRPLNGVSTFDLVLISKHILGVEKFDNPYQMIAADVNGSGTITAFDMVQTRQLILNITQEFVNSPSWRFVDATYEFTTDTPMAENYPIVKQVSDLQHDMIANFVAIKVGDVNGNARPNSLAIAEDRTTTNAFEIIVEDKVLKAGEKYTITFSTKQLAEIQGYQFTLGYENLKVEKLKSGLAEVENFGLHKMKEGMITTSWNQSPTAIGVSSGQSAVGSQQTSQLFSIEFTAQTDGKLSEQLSINNRPTPMEAYNENGDLMEVQLTFTTPLHDDKFDLFQNQPNPFHDKTMIGFYLPGDSEIQLILRDETGRIIHTLKDSRPQGNNTIDLDKKHLTNGFIYYQLTTKFGTKSKKMLRIQ